jgi:tetratricopeptide (TPR) repeat protein
MNSPHTPPVHHALRRPAFFLLLLALAAAAPLHAGRAKEDKEREQQEADARYNATQRPDYLFNTAMQSAEVRDWPRAHAYLDQAIAKAPANDQYIYAKAYLYFQAGNYTAALETAKKAEAMNGEVGAAQHIEAMALQALGKPEEAEPIFSRLCQDPAFVRNADTCGNLGELHWRLSLRTEDKAEKKSQLLKAQTAFSRLVELNSKDPRGQYYLGAIALELGQFDEAVSRCNTAFVLLEQLGYGNNALPALGPTYALCAARAELKVGNKNHAQELITEACRISPSANDCLAGEKILREIGS